MFVQHYNSDQTWSTQVSNGVSTSVASTPKPSTEAGGLPTPPPSASSTSRNKKPSQKDRQSFHDSFASFLSSDWEQKREENIKPDLEVSLYIIRRLTGWVLNVSTGFWFCVWNLLLQPEKKVAPPPKTPQTFEEFVQAQLQKDEQMRKMNIKDGEEVSPKF